MSYRIAVAGSTTYTVQMAQALADDHRFEVAWTLSPEPKRIGSDKNPTNNPLHQWSIQTQIPAFLVKSKIDQELRQQLVNANSIDFLLVVDFGYFIPTWLLALPRITPLNIHPSRLPEWRGSSPGQFALLHFGLLPNSETSAITLMSINQQLDQGPIIAQLPITIQASWTARDYYTHCFNVIATQLADLISNFGTGKHNPKEQTLLSPTMVARRLSKEDAFIDWQQLQEILGQETALPRPLPQQANDKLLTQLLGDNTLCPNRERQQQLLNNASHAFWPWPGLWTLVETSKGPRRMKIMPFRGNELQMVQIEGKTSCLWRECRNSVKS